MFKTCESNTGNLTELEKLNNDSDFSDQIIIKIYSFNAIF